MKRSAPEPGLSPFTPTHVKCSFRVMKQPRPDEVGYEEDIKQISPGALTIIISR